MYELFFTTKNFYLILFFCFIGSFLTCLALIKFNIFKEFVREELAHKNNNNNIGTCGGFAFISCLLMGIAFLNNYKILFFSTGVLMVILLWFYLKIQKFGKEVFDEYRLKFLFIIKIFLIINYSISLKIMNNSFSVLFITILFSFFLGFLDDLNKIFFKTGLTEKFLFRSQLLIGLIPVLFNYLNNKTTLGFLNYQIDLGILYIPIGLFIFSAVLNSSNLTDGLNGGLGFPTLIIQSFFLLFFIKSMFFCCVNPILIFDNNFFVIPSLLIVVLIPFLFFNMRGKLFMGNIGSVSIGAIIATLSILAKIEMLIPIFCILFVIETSSCIIQIYSIRKFKKKIWLFTPIHHHFELLGWKNLKIVKLMCFITLIGCLISYFLI